VAAQVRVIQLPNGRFQVDVRGRLPNGKNYRKRLTPNVTSAGGARSYGEAHWRAVLRGEVDGEARFPTLAAFFEEFKKIHFESSKRGPIKPSQREAYESHWRAHLKKRFGDYRLNEITDLEVKRFTADLRVGREPKTVNNVLTSLATMLARAAEWHGLKPPKIELARQEQIEIDYWSATDFMALVEAAHKRSKMHLALLLLGGHAGLRAGEILALRWSDVDFVRREITVRKAQWREHEGKPKSNKRRIVPMTSDLVVALEAMDPKTGRIIKAPRVDVATIETLRGMLGAIERAAGLGGEDPKGLVHKLRHTFGAQLATKGVSLQKIQKYMGHASFTTTLRYAHLAPSEMAEAILALDSVPIVPSSIPHVATIATQLRQYSHTNDDTQNS